MDTHPPFENDLIDQNQDITLHVDNETGILDIRAMDVLQCWEAWSMICATRSNWSRRYRNMKYDNLASTKLP